jgi:short-subunit dehydrogenase
VQTALITGASSGIGLELAKLFAADGIATILVARESDRLRAAAANLKSRAFPADLTDPDAPERIFESLKAERIDYLVNNAGFGLGGAVAKTDRRIELEMIQVNITALYDLTKLFLPGMLARGAGRIMNVASTAAFQPGPLMAVYYASKAFVLSFSEAVAEELAGTGVTVTTLCPGPTASDFQRRAGIEKTKMVEKKALGMMTSEEAARVGYRGMMDGKVIVIPGLLNRLGVQSLRLGPRAIVRKAAKKLQET